jgi:hypothetical protein
MLDLSDHGTATPTYRDLWQIVVGVFHFILDPAFVDYGLESKAIRSFSRFFTAYGSNDHPVVGLFSVDKSPLLRDADIRRYLRRTLRGAKMDIVAFDACSKGTLETAYAMNGIARMMIASEEEEPDGGWRYDDWLRNLEGHSDLDAYELTKSIQQSFENEYGHKPLFDTSQSTLNLKMLISLNRQIDKLSLSFIRHPELWSLIRRIRENELHSYAFQVVDLGQFLALLDAHLFSDKNNGAILRLVREMRNNLYLFVNQPPYASTSSEQRHGSTGVALFFPSSSDYATLPSFYNFHDKNSVLFARQHKWSRFLARYLSGH